MSNPSTNSGTSLPTLLLVLFIGLKLGSVIDWGWGWVLAPLWMPLVLVVAYILVVSLVEGCISLFRGFPGNKKW